MKHLKGFNEAVTKDQIDKLQDLCDNYLAYLLDDGFVVTVDDSNRYFNQRMQNNVIRRGQFNYRSPAGTYDKELANEPIDTCLIRIFTPNNNARFTWSSVKDYLLPFFQILSDNGYHITHNNQIIFSIDKNLFKSFRKDYSLESLLDETLEIDENLSQIRLRVRL